MSTLTVSLVQFDITWQQPDDNFRRLNRVIHPLTGHTDLIILPEMFSTGFTMDPETWFEEPEGPAYVWLHTMAGRTGACIAGSYIVRDNGKYFNRLLYVFPDGREYVYDKRHLFRMGEEHLHYTPGNQRIVIPFRNFRIKPFICYDLRFPVWIRSRNDADLLIFVANWPANRRNVWNILLKARAIENQMYVAGVNRTGKDGRNISYSGDSAVISPKGEILASLETGREGVLTCSIDLNELQRFREKFPVHLDADDFTLFA